MDRSLTNTQNDTIKTMLKAHTPQKDIADVINCSIRQVKRVKKNLANWGSVNAPKLSKAGQSSVLTKESIDVIHFLYITLDLCSISDNFMS